LASSVQFINVNYIVQNISLIRNIVFEDREPLQCVPAFAEFPVADPHTRALHPSQFLDSRVRVGRPRELFRPIHCIIRQNRLDLYSVSQLFPTFPVFPVADPHTRALHPSRFLDSCVRVGRPRELFKLIHCIIRQNRPDLYSVFDKISESRLGSASQFGSKPRPDQGCTTTYLHTLGLNLS
jgi:hypothetical protein